MGSNKVGYVTYKENIWSPLLRRQVIELLCEIRRADEEIELILVSFIPWYEFIRNRGRINDVETALNQEDIQLLSVPIPFPVPVYTRRKGVHAPWRYSWYTVPLIVLTELPVLVYARAFLEVRIFHCRSYPASIGGYFIGRIFSDVDYIFDPRSDFPEENIVSGNWTEDSRDYRTWKYLERLFCEDAISVIALGEPFLEHYSSLSSTENTDKIYNNVSTDLFQPNPEFREKYRTRHKMQDMTVIVYSGSMNRNSWNNPQEYAVAVRSILDTTKEDIGFLFLIPRSGRRGLVETFKEYGIDRTKFMVEHPAFDEIPKYLSVGDLGMYFLDRYSIRVGTKFVEYCSMGLPTMVNPNVGGACYLVQQENLGEVIKIGFEGNGIDISGLYEVIRNRNVLSKNCQTFASSNFSNKMVAAEYANIYRRIN